MGAGPAGLAAAIALAKHDREVVVFEKHSDCGARFFGDLQGIENWSSKVDVRHELEAFGIQVTFPCTPFHSVRGVSWDDEIYTFSSEIPLYLLVKRGTGADTLDAGLKRQALELGVRIEFGTTVQEEDVDIVAAGPRSQAIFAVDKGIIFKTDLDDDAYVVFDNGIAYMGYSYLLVSGGHGCLCTVLFDHFNRIHDYFEKTKERFERMLGLTIGETSPVGGVGTFSHRHEFVRGNRLYVGESAGLQDLLWGFGIRFALQSGNLAARCLIEQRNYSQAARAMFERRLRAGVVNRFFWEHFGNRGFKMFLKLGWRSREHRQFLFRFFQYSLLRRMLFPIALWDLRRRHPKLLY